MTKEKLGSVYDQAFNKLLECALGEIIPYGFTPRQKSIQEQQGRRYDTMESFEPVNGGDVLEGLAWG